ncbi:MAG: VanZ family protein [Actinomycetota bacterium]|nr:VanZ family protein [Actinomycetota bacterium]
MSAYLVTLVWTTVAAPAVGHWSYSVIPLSSTVDMFASQSYEYASSQILLNMLMYAPLGFLLPALDRRFGGVQRVLFAALICATTVELLQLMVNVLPGMARAKTPDVDNVLWGVLGAAVGYALFAGVASLKSGLRRPPSGPVESM